MLSDNETRVDLLYNEPIASTIANLIRAKPGVPVTIGVHGDWGAGKSSILEMIEAGFESDKKVLCLKFNGWRFQGFEDAKIALIEGIVTGLIEKRPALTKARKAVKSVFDRIDWLKVAKKAGGLALTAFTGLPSLGAVQDVIGSLTRIASDPTQFATKEHLEAALEGAKSLLKTETESKHVPEEIREFRKAFDDLLEEAGIEQLVVLIDDLDRCLPDTAIETLEAMRLFMFTSRTAFVVAADEAMIEYAVRRHFPDLPGSTGPRGYARNYLEKLVQVPFRIPALGEPETRIYVALLLIGEEIGDGDPGFTRLIGAARDKLRRPWQSTALDGDTVKASLGEKAPRAQNALTLSDQIGPILASGASGNPRQIKRFLNSLLLRVETAEARGFGDSVKLPVLAKLMLAERFLTAFFDQLASSAAAHPKGLCEGLAQLESETGTAEPASPEHPRSKSRPPVPAKAGSEEPAQAKSAPSGPKATLVDEWLSSPSIVAWARVQPPLADVDLRPYLFVTKDRKDYFGPATALGHLALVVEKLLGPRMSVEGMASELTGLSEPEGAKVFEGVRSKIIASDEFETEPRGAAGLSVLVKTHPVLQSKLVDLLEGLPPERLGPWAVSGYKVVITEPSQAARFEALLETWSSSASGNSILKTAASATLRTWKEKR